MIRTPVIVLGAPRSGTTMLYHALARHPDLWSLGGESNAILEGPLHPSRRGWVSNEEAADALDAAGAQALRAALERPLLPGWIWRYRQARREAEDGGPGPGAGSRLRYAWERWRAPGGGRAGVVRRE